MIKQRLATDCGIATLANAVNISYKESLQLYNQKNTGITIQETCAVLHMLNIDHKYIPCEGFPQVSGISDAITIHSSFIFEHKKQAILQVLTKSGLIHQVYFDGKNIIDPSPNANNMRVEDYSCVVDAVVVKIGGSDGS